jgi:hypothetical protein
MPAGDTEGSVDLHPVMAGWTFFAERGGTEWTISIHPFHYGFASNAVSFDLSI